MTHPYLGAYWPPRAESAEHIADRLHGFLHDFRDMDGTPYTWYFQGRSAKTSLREVDTSAAALTIRLEKSVRAGDALLPTTIGYSMSMWSGPTSSISLMLRAGSLTPYHQVPNSLVLGFPDEAIETALAPTPARQLIESVVHHWQPRWAVITTSELREQFSQDGPEVPGWITVTPQGMYVAAETLDQTTLEKIAQLALPKDTAAVGRNYHLFAWPV